LNFALDVAHRRPTVYDNTASLIFKDISILADYDEMAKICGGTEVKISLLSNHKSKPPFTTEITNFKSFLTHFHSDEVYASTHYLQQVDMKHHLLGLIEKAGIALDAPNLLCNGLLPYEFTHSPTFFIGAKGVQTSLHYDRANDAIIYPYHQHNDFGRHNYFFQVSGSRRFILLPNRFLKDLCPLRNTPWPNVSQCTCFLNSIYENCPEDDESKQLEYIEKSAFPELVTVWPNRMEIILRAGEALLIPARWWYTCEILETGTAVNWWFIVDKQAQLVRSRTLSADSLEHHQHQKCVIS
jgi:hypothetical protein